MAAPYTRVLSAAATSAACPHDTGANPFALTLALVFSGTATAKIQYSVDDVALATDAIGTGMTWFDHPTLAGLSANASGNIAFPVAATRLVVTAWTSGSVTMTALQAGH